MLATQSFLLLGDEVNPKDVPYRTLYNGDKMPAIGLGTFGSDHISHDTVAQAVYQGAAVGYRHFDCAAVYDNEKYIGHALQDIMNTGIGRDELWITSKLWNDKHSPEDVIPACEKTLRDLQLDYLDLYLVHWPFPNFHPPKCDVDSRSPDATPYIHEKFMKTWREMEKLVSMGLVKNIGTSNVTVPKLELIVRDARIQPAVNEMELHPHMQQEELFNFVRTNNIVPVGYCPIGSPARPERDKTAEDTCDVEDPVVIEIAEKHGIHPATLCVKWAQQRGQIPIPFSTKRRNMLANLKAITTKPLDDEDMQRLSEIDKNCRLIKGHVFLWESAKDWKDLWDLDGEIVKG